MQYEQNVTRLGQMSEFTCSNTFARSTGAVTRVVGTADRKPAVASSVVESLSLVRFGVRLKMSCLEASYALGQHHQPLVGLWKESSYTQKEIAKIGVTPSNGGTIPRYML